jgi:hypothetical protein
VAQRNARRRERFFRQHPNCCFCGGIVTAEEEDHFPSRALFLGRRWPEGYVFPACCNCNHVTARDELLVAWLSRTRDHVEHDPTRRAELEKLFAEIPRFFPGLLEGMRRITHRELRDARKKMGLTTLPPGVASTDLPLLSVKDERFHDAALNFGRKLGLALYYKHTGKALPKVGGVAVRWYSNIQIENDEIPRQLEAVLPHFPKLQRAQQNLSDQFFYRIGVQTDMNLATYLAIFRKSFGILGFISTDISVLKDLREGDGRRTFHVYDWPP